MLPPAHRARFRCSSRAPATLAGVSAMITKHEIKLLLACVRPGTDQTAIPLIRSLLEPEIDWLYLIGLAERNGLLPLLSWRLDSACPEAVPEPLMEQLRQYFYANGLRDRYLRAELLDLLDRFADTDM